MLPFFFDSKWAFPFALSSHCHYPFRPLFSHLSSFRAQANFFQLHIKYCRIVMAVFWFLFFSFTFAFSHADTTAISADLLSLLSFKSSISRDPSNLLSNWNLTVNHCTWNGVTCHHLSGRVTALNFSFSVSSSRALYGTLKESIGNLTELRALSLANNGFSGEIPANIGQLQFLEVLELQGSNFSGHIPYQISYLQSLRLLNLSRNSLSGSIPDKLIGNGGLRVIDLSYNLLSGEIRIDVNSKCEFLHHLKLSYNFLVGNIPPEIGKCENLRTLLLDWNILEGRIPAEIGRISELRVLDVSRNSLTDRIPRELGNCRKLAIVVLTNLVDESGLISTDTSRLEFNAFDGGVPHELLLLPGLEILWAPRANLGGRLPANWSNSCSLKVLNLGQNYIDGVVPENLGLCKNLTFLDLSSNNLLGYLPSALQVPCMAYFNISRNNITGFLPRFGKAICETNYSFFSYGLQEIETSYTDVRFWGSQVRVFGSLTGDIDDPVISHDFSWNRFIGSIPLFSVGDGILVNSHALSYRLLLNNNMLNGSLQADLLSKCDDMVSFSVNLSANQISGEIHEVLPLGCMKLIELEAAENQIHGLVPPDIDKLKMLQRLNLRGNRLSGALPGQFGLLKNLKWVFLGGNSLTGEIPSQIGQLDSLIVLDLSHNALTGYIPANLTNAKNLKVVLLDHNKLYGEVPSSFSSLSDLSILDVSYNNLSGHIPQLQHQDDCGFFKGNRYLDPCPEQSSASSTLPVPLDIQKQRRQRKLKYLVVAVATSSVIVLCILLLVVVIIFLRKRKFGRLASLRGKTLVTFADAPVELDYDSVVRATGNFSIRNLIGTGGFGSTYKAELIPGYLVAVKRLSIGRFQGLQQFDAEIRTLGRIRHKNLVTLIGCYVGEAEMFLIYNYLSGGNLETFIHEKSGKNSEWSVIHKIAMDIAQALAYLHYTCVPRIVHRDIKPSNILLDEKLNAYLSDFGLARLLEVSETHATTDVAGTFGYVAPEYATTCRVSDKADVYSFGVVLLELISGKKSLDPSFSEYGNGFNIVAWARLLIKEGRSSEVFSPELWEAGPEENLLGMLRLASVCTVEMLPIRPSMDQVLETLKQLKL